MNSPAPDTETAPTGQPRAADLRSFWMLVATMFQGALSDNIFKLVLVMLVLNLAESDAAEALGADATAAALRQGATELGSTYQGIVSAVFTLPFALAVAFAGWIGDRFSKARVTQWTKLLEVAVMVLAALVLGFGGAIAGKNMAWMAVGVLFLMGFQSALFSPSKYGIMPELMPEERVGWANGILQGFTFIAIVVGTIAGPWLYETFEQRLEVVGLVLIVLALVGTCTSYMMNPLQAANPEEKFIFNPWPMLRRYGAIIMASVGLRWGILGGVIWWGVAVALQGAAVLTAKAVLGLTPAQTGLALLPVVLGMGFGSFFVSFISRDRIELGLVPLGAFGMFLTCGLLWYFMPATEVMASLAETDPAALASYRLYLPLGMGLVGLTTGFFVVPLEAYVVATCDAHYRAGVLATYNVLGAVGMIAGSIVGAEIAARTGSTGDVFLACGLSMLITCGIICWRFPQIPASLGGLFGKGRQA